MIRLIDADAFKKRVLSAQYIYLQENKEDVIDAIDCEVTYFKEEHPDFKEEHPDFKEEHPDFKEI